MLNDDIRYKLLHELEDVKRLMLTDHHVRIINSAGKGITSSELADKFNISIQGASGVLTRLYRSGYLERANAGDPTGGNLYIYKARI